MIPTAINEAIRPYSIALYSRRTTFVAEKPGEMRHDSAPSWLASGNSIAAVTTPCSGRIYVKRHTS